MTLFGGFSIGSTSQLDRETLQNVVSELPDYTRTTWTLSDELKAKTFVRYIIDKKTRITKTNLSSYFDFGLYDYDSESFTDDKFFVYALGLRWIHTIKKNIQNGIKYSCTIEYIENIPGLRLSCDNHDIFIYNENLLGSLLNMMFFINDISTSKKSHNVTFSVRSSEFVQEVHTFDNASQAIKHVETMIKSFFDELLEGKYSAPGTDYSYPLNALGLHPGVYIYKHDESNPATGKWLYFANGNMGDANNDSTQLLNMTKNYTHSSAPRIVICGNNRDSAVYLHTSDYLIFEMYEFVLRYKSYCRFNNYRHIPVDKESIRTALDYIVCKSDLLFSRTKRSNT